MQEWLQGYLGGTISPHELTISYHIGDEFSGETDFQLGGDGTYALWSTVTRGRARRTFRGQVDHSEVRVLVQEFLDTEIWNVRHVQCIPGDDDPEAVIAVSAAKRGRRSRFGCQKSTGNQPLHGHNTSSWS